MKTSRYEKALSLCTAINDKYRNWINTPFVVNEYAMATNSHVLAYTLKENAKTTQPPIDGKPHDDILNMFRNSNAREIFTVERMQQAIDKCEKVDEFTEGYACNICDENGFVVWEFEKNGEFFDKTDDCPKCDGIGKLGVGRTGKKILSSHEKLKIADRFISAINLQKMIDVCDVMGVSAVELCYSSESYLIFEIDGLKLLIMCLYQDQSIFPLPIIV